MAESYGSGYSRPANYQLNDLASRRFGRAIGSDYYSAKLTVAQDISQLLDSWIEAEKNGVEFPVPFEAAWRMAEYSNKANAKRDGLKALKKGKQFSSEMMKTPGGGRSSELINLSVDGFKHFCLMADTAAGETIRQYFIEAEKKWSLVQKIAPKVADEIELIQAQQCLADKQTALAEAQKLAHQAELKLAEFRRYVTTAIPKAIGDRILGVTEIETIKTKEVVIDQRGQILGHVPGESYNKKELCERYGILTKTGKPDYKQINAYLEGLKLPGDAWDDRMVVSHNPQLKAEYLPALDRLLGKTDHQQWIGEQP